MQQQHSQQRDELQYQHKHQTWYGLRRLRYVPYVSELLHSNTADRHFDPSGKIC